MEKNIEKKSSGRASFSGRLGYVFAVAGSAVGLGNIWRFPYLAAKYGGGMFLLVYLILMVTFGYALIMSETALGRMTKSSSVGAFKRFGSSFPFKFGGWINAVVPMLIFPYYSVIGGWVLKYLWEYIAGNGASLTESSYFTSFISNSVQVEWWFLIFALLVFGVILAGVQKGVERVSKVMMPMLIVLACFLAGYVVLQPGAWEGVKYFLIPDFNNFSWMTVVAAMGQMFYSLSIAMGVLYTYGSYINKDVDIEKTTEQVELFDTGVALLAGLMIIPAVFVFSGGDLNTLQAGPSLVFITLPKIFSSMSGGFFAAIAFFLMFFVAALTSAISLLEASVCALHDELGLSRKKCCIIMAVVLFVVGTACALGFGVWDFVTIFGMQFLDFFDFLTNSIMMPIAALATCFLILGAVKFSRIDAEIEQSSAFKRKHLYHMFMKYLAPACIAIILISSLASVLGFISF